MLLECRAIHNRADSGSIRQSQGQQGPHGGCARRRHIRRTPGRHDLGATPSRTKTSSSCCRVTPEACVQHRHRDLQQLRWRRQDHRLHRRSCGDRQAPHPPRQQSRWRPRAAFTAVSGATSGPLIRLIGVQAHEKDQRLRHQRRARQGRCCLEPGNHRKIALKDSISVGSGTKFAPTARRNAG